MIARALIKTFAYRTGALGALHRARFARCLTVVMLHRVLPEADMRREEADPLYTVSPELLGSIVEFLTRNYAVVSAEDVLASVQRENPLPPRPLLITFDDGWRDNIEWAARVLGGVPWTLFVASEAMSEPDCWWQEVLLWALRTGRASYRALWREAACDRTDGPVGADAADVMALLLRYGSLTTVRRRDALAVYERELRSRCGSRHMLTGDEISALRRSGVAIGAHGASHLPLSHVANARDDLTRAKASLESVRALPVMSFPHGRYNDAAIGAARKLGYGAIFTSDPVLNPCTDGWLQSDVIGRISITTAAVCNKEGALAPERLAAWLWHRDVANLAAARGNELM